MWHGNLIEVVSNVGIEPRLAIWQVLTGPLVRKAIRCIEQPLAAAFGIEVLLRDLPNFVLQHGQSVFGQVDELAVECIRARVPFGQSCLKVCVGLWQLALGGRLATLILGS